MNGPARPTSPNACSIRLLFSVLFLLFGILAQPHRVHHAFDHSAQAETATAEDGHPSDHHPSNPPKTDCVILSLTRNCPLGSIEYAVLAVTLAVLAAPDRPPLGQFNRFTFGSVSPRAPPSISVTFQ
jgi:hypothetical protein